MSDTMLTPGRQALLPSSAHAANTHANPLDINTSAWTAGLPPYTPRPPLQGAVQADVVVIGGGFTGVSTALHMARRFPDRRIVLVEALTLGNGASGRNGGQVLNWFNGSDPKDPLQLRRHYEFTRSGIDLIESLATEASQSGELPPHIPIFRREGAFEFFTNMARAEEAKARVARCAAAGIPLQYLTGEALSKAFQIEGVTGGVFDATAGSLNGVAYLRGLRAVLLKAGVEVFEQTPVLSIREGKTLELTLPGGTLRAGAMVLATNGYTPRLGYFRYQLTPLHAHVLATEPLTRDAWDARGWHSGNSFADDRDRIAYGALSPDGRLIFGGGSNASYGYHFGGKVSWPGTPTSIPERFNTIQKLLHTYLPTTRDLSISHRWTGLIGMTLDRMCMMGVRGEHKNIYYSLGYSGHGVTLANLAGVVLTDLYAGDHQKWHDLPCYQHTSPFMPPEPFRWVGYHVWTKLTGRSPRKSR